MKQIDQVIDQLERDLATARAFKALAERNSAETTVQTTTPTIRKNGNGHHKHAGWKEIQNAVFGVLERQRQFGLGGVTAREVRETLRGQGQKFRPKQVQMCLYHQRNKNRVHSTRTPGTGLKYILA